MTVPATARRSAAQAAYRQHHQRDGRPKTAHPTETAATDHMDRLIQANPHRELCTYRCDWCAAWHVGNSNR